MCAPIAPHTLDFKKSGSLAFEDMFRIGLEQVAREEALVQQSNRYLLCDTTPLTTLFYSIAMSGRADPQLEALVERTYDTIMLCAHDFPLVQDGTRRDTHFRPKQYIWYRNMLDRKQNAYTVLAGTLAQRLQHATSLLI